MNSQTSKVIGLPDTIHLFYSLHDMKEFCLNLIFGYFRHKGSFVCESDVTYIRPGWAKNWKNKWVAVVNTEKYPQSIRVELCK